MIPGVYILVFISLSVGLLAALHKKLQADLAEIFQEG